MEKTGVIVRVGATVEVEMELKPSEQAVEISVTAETPVVDTKSTKTTFSIDKRHDQEPPREQGYL